MPDRLTLVQRRIELDVAEPRLEFPGIEFRIKAGLGAALLAHVLTDVVIFSIVAATAVHLPG